MAFLMATSCVSDLDQTPVSSITDGSFWQNENDAIAAVGGMHDRLRNIMSFNYFEWGDMRGEYYDYGFEVTHGDGYQYYFENRLNPSNAGAQFEPIYRTISEANAILHFVPNIDSMVEDEKNDVLGMAYGIRAYCYFLLARVWGEVPILDEHISDYSDVSDLQVSRSSIDEVYNLIDNDIELGLSLMAGSDGFENKYYMSRAALLAIKAEVALTKAGLLGQDVPQNAQIALDAINECLGNSSIGLINNYEDIFDTNNKLNNEIIWAMPYFINEVTTKPLPSRMYVSFDKYSQLESGTGGNLDETYITFETGSFVSGDDQTGDSYTAWEGGTTANGAWIGPETAGAIGWDNDGGANSLAGNTLEPPFNNVGNGYARVRISENVLIKLPETMSDVKYLGLLAKLAGNTSSFTEEERTVNFEVSTNQGVSWNDLASIVIDAGYAQNTKLHEIELNSKVEKQNGPLWIRFSTNAVNIHILDNIRILTEDYVFIPSQNDVNPGNNSVSFNYLTYKPEVCKDFLQRGDSRAQHTFKLLFDDDGTDLGGIAYKYRGEYDTTTGNRNYISDIILYRAGELILMAAEANLLLGNFPQTLDNITQVRDRAGVTTNIALDQDSLRQALIDEYFLETMGEGKRWFQLLRFGGDQTVKSILEKVAPGEYLYEDIPTYNPLSTSILTRNPNLSQTNGY